MRSVLLITKKARHSLAMDGHDDEEDEEYDDHLFHVGTREFIDMVSVPAIVSEARQARKKALAEMAASIIKNMAKHGTPQYEHASTTKDEAAAKATRVTLVAFREARKAEKERRARRLEEAAKQKAAAQAKMDKIREESAKLDAFIAEQGLAVLDDEWTHEKSDAPPEATPSPVPTKTCKSRRGS